MTGEPTGFERLAEQSRLDARMRRDDEAYTPEEQQALIAELRDYRIEQRVNGKPLAWKEVAARVGIAETVLNETVSGAYKGDVQKQLRLIDQFLADQRLRRGRFDDRAFASIGITRQIRGVVINGIKNNSMPCIIGPSGSGKSMTARAIAAERDGVIFIRVDEAHGDDRGVTGLLCNAINALRPMADKAHRKRVESLRAYLSKHKSCIVVVDEAQKLDRAGLEMLRDLHDTSDLDGRHNVPIVLFADQNFYKLIAKSRAGQRSPVAPQLTRRMYPIFDIERDGCDDGGRVYSVGDVVAILRNDRLRIVSDAGVKWLTKLANTPGYGAMGFAMACCRMAADLSKGDTVDVRHLSDALRMALGPEVAEEVDEVSGGGLLAAAG